MSTPQEKEEFESNVADAFDNDFLFVYRVLLLLSTESNVISSTDVVENYALSTIAKEEDGVLMGGGWSIKSGMNLSRNILYNENTDIGERFKTSVSSLIDIIKDAIPPDWFDEMVGTRGTQGQQLFVSEELAKGYADTQRSILDVLQRPTSTSSTPLSSSSSSQINCPISLGNEKEKDKKKKKKKKDRSVLLKSEHSGEMIDL